MIISSDRATKQAQKVIFDSSFMALHGVTYVAFLLYPIKLILHNKLFLLKIFRCEFKLVVAII